jgi:hypothetical protein
MSAAPRFCRSCGAALEAGDRFCGGCGAAVRGAQASPPHSKSMPPPGPAARRQSSPPPGPAARPEQPAVATSLPPPSPDATGSRSRTVTTIVLVVLLIIFGFAKRYPARVEEWFASVFGR